MYNGLDYKNRVVVGLIIIFALLFFCAGISIYQLTLPVVTIKVNNVEIREEQEVPAFEVSAECKRQRYHVLDEITGYQIKDLLNDLNQGKGYIVDSDVDNMNEGEYLIHLDLEQELKEKILYTWGYKVRYRIETGTVKVLNKYGDWEGKRFKKLDGTYASGWTNLGEDTYYFDESGNCVTGEQQIGINTYYFLKDGRFDTEKNPVNPNRPMIALTFDDGPGKYTMQLLELLKAYDSKATFFMLGQCVDKYPEEIKKMKELGCDIGNHTTNHKNLTKLKPEEVAHELLTTNVMLENIIGQGATMMRPPYGAVNASVQNIVGSPVVMWSVDTRDWESKNAAVVCDYILKTVKDGDIVLLHDIHETTVQASIQAIPKLVEQGYQLVTVSEMARARGVNLENGAKYFEFYK